MGNFYTKYKMGFVSVGIRGVKRIPKSTPTPPSGYMWEQRAGESAAGSTTVIRMCTLSCHAGSYPM